LKEQLGRPWYELYDGPKPLIVGHQDYLGTGMPLIWKDRVLGLDTSVHLGGALTGLLLPEFRVISVPSRGHHWSEVRRRQAEQAVETLLRRVEDVHAEILARVRAEGPYDDLRPKEQGQRYAVHAKGSPLASLLHLRRQGRLDRQIIRTRFRRPADLLVFCDRLGLGR
jgi:hypothetical protein